MNVLNNLDWEGSVTIVHFFPTSLRMDAMVHNIILLFNITLILQHSQLALVLTYWMTVTETLGSVWVVQICRLEENVKTAFLTVT